MGSVLSASDQATLDALVDRAYPPSVLAEREHHLVQTIVHEYCRGSRRQVEAWLERVQREGRPVAAWPALRERLLAALRGGRP